MMEDGMLKKEDMKELNCLAMASFVCRMAASNLGHFSLSTVMLYGGIRGRASQACPTLPCKSCDEKDRSSGGSKS
jgi:hypothetical protein